MDRYPHINDHALIGDLQTAEPVSTDETGLIADLILRRHGAAKSIGDVPRDVSRQAQVSKEAQQ